MDDLPVNRYGNLTLSQDGVMQDLPDPAVVLITKGTLIVCGTGTEDYWGVTGLVEALQDFNPLKQVAAFHAEGNAIEGLDWELGYYRWLVANGFVKDLSKNATLLSPRLYIPEGLLEDLN